jgi:hypothetical protein
MNMNLQLKDTGDAATSLREESQDRGSTRDLRRHPRRPFSGRVTCAELGHCELAALDISSGGVGLLSPQVCLPGQQVTLLFLDDSFSVKGVISRVRTVFSCDWQVGVTFLQEQPNLLKAIGAIA